MLNGLKHGSGTLRAGEGFPSYEGAWAGGARHGRGVLRYLPGSFQTRAAAPACLPLLNMAGTTRRARSFTTVNGGRTRSTARAQWCTRRATSTAAAGRTMPSTATGRWSGARLASSTRASGRAGCSTGRSPAVTPTMHRCDTARLARPVPHTLSFIPPHARAGRARLAAPPSLQQPVPAARALRRRVGGWEARGPRHLLAPSRNLPNPSASLPSQGPVRCRSPGAVAFT